MSAIVSPETARAHDEVVAFIATIPEEALDWQPGGEEWSLRQIIEHISGVGAFYGYIVEAARASNFGLVTFNREEVGRRLAGHQAAFAQCRTVPQVLAYFERAYRQGLDVLEAIAPDELHRPFQLQTMRPGGEPATVTLRRRVVESMGGHLREHAGQLRETLERWRQAQGAGA